ncbi:zona pellucida sperm-binding protein 4-like [Archocentrus centrarchus]|uniref:zona pellucida sperm-binding protein 4-like n=1 Tax=Archocentrus centrarchus TaxID=63155 RepID=UPI0011EA4C4C|nr:zona pellucida sperm-binding protein 4-like [Archocentrus centrarchus]
MAMKLTCCCLLALILLGCWADAQNYGQGSQNPPSPKRPKPETPRYPPSPPQQPSKPQQPQQPQQPSKPQQPKQPQQPQNPLAPFHTCEVADNYKIRCGASTISASECDAINCCFDGHMCYYGKSVTLQCTKDAQFIVVVARDATLPNIDLESISFSEKGQNCNPVGTTSAFVIYQFPVTTCGTVVIEEPGVVIYQNKMTSLFEVVTGPYGSITRDTYYELWVQCRYVGTTVEALVIEVGLVPQPIPVAAAGPLRVELKLANGHCIAKGCIEEEEAYTSFYTSADYPVRKVLRDPVYVEVYMMERTDPNLVLTLGRCWVTSSPYPHSLPQWDLLIDGCPYRDDRYLTTLLPRPSSGYKFPSHHRRFVFKLFSFVGDRVVSPGQKVPKNPDNMPPIQEKLYIHCDVAVCQPTLGNNCEPRCLRKRREIAGSIKKGTREDTSVVSSLELIFVETDPNRSSS